MHKSRSPLRTCVALAVLGLTGVSVGCGNNPNPVDPSPIMGAQTSATVAASPSSATAAPAAVGSAAHLNPTELATRGWTCFQPPVPNRIVCSRPNQGVPTIGDPPPGDRPATFTFLVFDGSGHFTGTELLIRTDLYQGQLCESTGEPFIFRARIGYYECVRTTGP